MKLLAIVTDERRPGVCPRCQQAVEYSKFRARNAAGTVRGVYWAPAAHDCKPIAGLEPVAGERTS